MKAAVKAEDEDCNLPSSDEELDLADELPGDILPTDIFTACTFGDVDSITDACEVRTALYATCTRTVSHICTFTVVHRRMLPLRIVSTSLD